MIKLNNKLAPSCENEGANFALFIAEKGAKISACGQICGQKNSEFRVVRKWWENTRFSPENAKNKAENGWLNSDKELIYLSTVS